MIIINEVCYVHIFTKIIINNSRNASCILNGKSVYVIATEIMSPTDYQHYYLTSLYIFNLIFIIEFYLNEISAQN